MPLAPLVLFLSPAQAAAIPPLYTPPAIGDFDFYWATVPATFGELELDEDTVPATFGELLLADALTFGDLVLC